MAKPVAKLENPTCAKCGEPFATLAAGLLHIQKVHGATRQQAQNELKIHARKR